MAMWGIERVGSLPIILPVGISFYTFQSLSYTIDVYRKKIVAEKDFLKLALYISFFPQLVAGPIVRASDFLPQLEEHRNVSLHNFKIGIQIGIFGLFKKVVIADWLSVFVDDVFSTPNAFHAMSILLAVIAYAIQIYFDFSGYSDMAIGCAKCLGYDFARNFNMPYISRNISEFWRRWHISLSSWLKEYVYIPMGGNRKGICRTYIHNMVTMLLGGLWHGADWTFVAWGGVHGIALCIHKVYRNHFIKINKCLLSPPPPEMV
jgi:alginate O-acetyltransferase complex protein AlgI